jgi:hypothetical protein
MSIKALVIGSVLLVAPTLCAAEVNCKFVLKNLSLPGRTVESVAETMSISEDDIRACQEKAKKEEGQKGDSGEAAKGGSAD